MTNIHDQAPAEDTYELVYQCRLSLSRQTIVLVADLLRASQGDRLAVA